MRDFSAHDVAAGTHTANLREVAERALAARGVRAQEIRSREVRGARGRRGGARAARHRLRDLDRPRALPRVRDARRPHRRVRAPLAARAARGDPELGGSALLREVHVYGASLPLGERRGAAAQHAGLGRALVDAAARVAREAGFRSLAVISAVGTRPYYRRLGFADGELYQHRALS